MVNAMKSIPPQSDEEEQRLLITEDAAPVQNAGGSEEIRALWEEMQALKQHQQEMNEALAAAPADANVNRNRRGFSIFLNADGGKRAKDNDGNVDEEHVLEEDTFSLMMLNKYHRVCPHPFPRILQFCIRTLCILFGLFLNYPDKLTFLQYGYVDARYIPCIILGIMMIILNPKIARYLPPQMSILCRLIPCIYVIYYLIIYHPFFDPKHRYWEYDKKRVYRDYILYIIFGMAMIVMSRKIAILFKYILCMSTPWALGLLTFGVFQIGLGSAIIYDQLVNTRNECDENVGGDSCVPFGIPYRVGAGVTFARYVTVLLVLATQTDILTSIQTVLLLRNADHVHWNEVIGEPEDNKTWGMWILRILLPNVLKFIQGVVILFASFVIIVQSNSVIDLLKDSTALLFVSQADNIMFYLTDLGYLGEELKHKAAEVKAARWPAQLAGNEEGHDGKNDSNGCVSRLSKYVRHHFNLRGFILCLLISMMIGSLSYVVAREFDGTWMKRRYPGCDVERPRLIGNGRCDYWPPQQHALYSSETCGYDGGDCEVKPVNGYPNCVLPLEVHDLIGNGICFNVAPYNSTECGFDGGDCLNVTNQEYPECKFFMGDGNCYDFPPYNSEICGFDGGDCVPKPVNGYDGCMVHNPEKIGDGYCDDYGPYNGEICGFDGGDCVPKPVNGYDGCMVHNPEKIGDGYCANFFPPYNTEQCGFDGGDCIYKPVDGYLNCTLLPQFHDIIGDGECYDYPPYNSEICGFDGGDCVPKPVSGYPGCRVHDPNVIGDGECYDFPPYNTEACGWDGGDCL